MKTKTIILFLLGLFLLSPVYAFCEDGEQGSIEIVSITDNLEDNFKKWEWGEGQEIELTVKVENNLNTSQDFTTEIMFLDGDDTIYLVVDNTDLIETVRVSGENDKEIKFSFEIEDDIRLSNYDMVVKTYVTQNESNYCSQEEVVIKTNGFDYCEDDGNLTIQSITDSENWSWMFDEEQSIDVEIKSELSSDDYDIELIFYDSDSKEYNVAEDSDNLIETVTFANKTVVVNFEFTPRLEMEDGNYGLYVKVTSNRACAEKRIYENYKKGTSTLKDYDIISIKDEPGIIIKDAIGPNSFVAGKEITYRIELRNTGENEPQVEVWIYNLQYNIKAQNVIYNFKKDTTRFAEVSFVPSGTPGLLSLYFYAQYGYNNDSGHFTEETTDNHKIRKRVTLLTPEVKVVTPITEVTPAPVTKQQPIPQESKSIIPTAIAIVIILMSIIIGLVIYKKLRKDKVVQQNPYS
ncbi:hypothetical protein LCGC14_0442230 [marine sediment metagenome]|uniref:CARDB domain-containing protein n=1 Tax=marine sediment metagenome TaxID=412755 RepID=A0A0F9VUF9_9ZZZZ